MNLLIKNDPIKGIKIPKADAITGLPKDWNYSIEIELQPLEYKLSNTDDRTTYAIAKVLQEHIDTVSESRRLIDEGKYETWGNFIKPHGKRKIR